MSESGTSIEVMDTNSLDVAIADVTLTTKVMVLKDLAYACIVRIDYFQRAKLKIDF